MPTDVTIRIVPDADRLAGEGAALVAQVAHEAIRARGICRIALSGGSTPRALYQRLAAQHHAGWVADARSPWPTGDQAGSPAGGAVRSGIDGAVGSPAAAAAELARGAPAGQSPASSPAVTQQPPHVPPIDWSRVELFFGDERLVPPDDPESNYRMVQEALLVHVPLREAQVHRVRAEAGDPAQAAAAYEETLRTAFGIGAGEVPRFDLVLLGMGPDGHTASLFPHAPALAEQEHLATAVYVPQMKTPWRVTLTTPVLNHAWRAMVLASGTEKAETLHAVLEGPPDPDRLPIQRIALDQGLLMWLVDTAAASRLYGPGNRVTPDII